jgi:hypothetical protein
VIRIGAPTQGCELNVSYAGEERRAIVRRVEHALPSMPDLASLPVVEADEV